MTNMILTKKYKIVHNGTNMLVPNIEYEVGVVTYVPEGATAVEFESRESAEEYIADNNLVYEPPVEN